MTALYVQFGFVTTQRSLVDFLTEVFGFEELASHEVAIGTVVKLKGPGTTVANVLVPNEPPRPAVRADPFYAAAGLRYVTIRVDDLNATVERARARGGRLVGAVEDIGPVRLAFVEDPEGNCFEVTESRT